MSNIIKIHISIHSVGYFLRNVEHRNVKFPAIPMAKSYIRLVPFISILGPNPMVVLNSLDVLQETFLKKAVEFSDRPTMVSSG